ncbi:hypothetical protein BCIN_11g05320 [Botrytis cinerea B05.10]|uniref:Uncharacterized protein n=1 Tax=Botryotinia fuckeliana (strain B05.10) TaxID=332648 RepID=A0A384JYC0_BOTFB|nr:hypothetical protein BCIN_11g05320 [Botrytis cinerea B05.10]ATZ55257.1 hypothetical protein BCIN_11g05320 [Botrytis cinerea B05.10]
MNASVKEDRTTSLMKCVFHIVRSQALNGPEPQSRKDIIDNFIIIHYGVCAKDLLPIIEQMIEVKVLLPSGNREICWKGIDGRTERENSPLFTIHPECNINKYRAIETCAKHRYKYLRPPQSTLGSEVAKLTKRCVASVRSGNDLETDKLIHQAINLTKDHSRKFHKDYRFTQATIGDASTSSIIENKSLDSCDRTNLPIVHPEDNAVPSNSQPFSSLQSSRKKDEDNSGQRLGIYGITSMLRDLNSKYPNDKIKVVSKNNELWFECQDCPAKLYKISQGGSCIYHIRSHIEGAAHADRVESRVTRNSETTITTRYVQVRKERLEKIRGKDPMSSRWTWWLDENQAPKSRNGIFANEKNINDTLATKSAVAKQSATPSYPEKSSGDVN